jgi:hypothetical protein
MGVEAGLGAVAPPLSPRIPPLFASFHLLGIHACETEERLGPRSRRRLCFMYEDEFLHSATRIVQYPRTATIVHALTVKIQVAGGD